MKKTFITFVLIALCVIPASAENWPFIRNAPPYTTLLTLVSDTSTTVVTGPTTTLDLAFKRFGCQVIWSGPTPTTTTAIFQGSLDGTNFYTLDTRVVSTSPYLYSIETATPVIIPPVFYIRGGLTARTASTWSTTMTTGMKCIAAH
jgi:hypothetical protein